LLAKEHNAATDAAIDAYIADVEKYTTSTDQLEDDFEPLDRARTKVYRELIEVRQAMVATLSAKEWDKVFG
jgi:predicted metal-dependent peptidase